MALKLKNDEKRAALSITENLMISDSILRNKEPFMYFIHRRTNTSFAQTNSSFYSKYSSSGCRMQLPFSALFFFFAFVTQSNWVCLSFLHQVCLQAVFCCALL